MSSGGRPAGVERDDPHSVTGDVNAAGRIDAPCVVLVSLDGFASRYLDRYDAPALRELGARGVWARDGMMTPPSGIDGTPSYWDGVVR